MFNMENVGRKISELRKGRNMTQMEVADLMGISVQAVSNWERGNSMPDISKLPELAKIFGVSIDEILGEKSELVENLARGNVEDYLENNEISVDELTQIAPILKPEQVNEVFEGITVSSLKDVEDVLPFIGTKIVDEILRKVAEQGMYKDLDIAAPFASQKAVDDVGSLVFEKAGFDGIVDLLPFMSKATIGRLLLKAVQEGSVSEEAFPFADKKDIDSAAEAAYRQSGMAILEKWDIIPFISKEKLKELAEMEFSRSGLRKMDPIYPFLPEDYLNELAWRAVQKDGIKAISDIAPFLGKETFAKFVKESFL